MSDFYFKFLSAFCSTHSSASKEKESLKLPWRISFIFLRRCIQYEQNSGAKSRLLVFWRSRQCDGCCLYAPLGSDQGKILAFISVCHRNQEHFKGPTRIILINNFIFSIQERKWKMKIHLSFVMFEKKMKLEKIKTQTI